MLEYMSPVYVANLMLRQGLEDKTKKYGVLERSNECHGFQFRRQSNDEPNVWNKLFMQLQELQHEPKSSCGSIPSNWSAFLRNSSGVIVSPLQLLASSGDSQNVSANQVL